jgi:SNF2 family DNA or RNA helicase
VAVAFVSEVVAIGQALGYTVPYLGGGVHPAESVRIVERWNRGEIPVLLAHPTSVAHGLNLQSGGHAVCWYGLTWNLEEYLQLNARVWRQGQNKPVVIHSLVARGTVDELMLLRLMDKAAAQERLFDALSRERTI